jgi:SAM-dependent methyltransferase
MSAGVMRSINKSVRIVVMNEDELLAAPSVWVQRFAPLIPAGGEVLDLACGRGRHARLLATLGYRVEAVDQDEQALAELAGVPGVLVRRADLEGGPWPYFGRAFDGIVVTNYLHRPLLPNLLAALAEGGVLIYETFMTGNERFGRPANPAYLLRSGELLELVRRRLTVVAFEQGEVEAPRPAVMQRLCVCRKSEVRLL